VVIFQPRRLRGWLPEPFHAILGLKKMIEDLAKNHVPDFCRWISNKSAVEYSLSAFQPERSAAWVEQYVLKILNDRSSWNQVIVVDEMAIGYCGLSNISMQNRNAEYFILIGDDGYWNRGIGTQAGIEVLKYGFDVLQFHRIWLTVSECNHGAVRSYAKLGFKMEGRMRDACHRRSEYHDKIVMGILSDDCPGHFFSGSAKPFPEKRRWDGP
jgi:RimJ/RimL family protein N-acetyltransferase